ncbi:nucleoporin GLE1 [Cimex lectularius]|uniref:mRNA export factor GLE1 n=1 Tax=Cimex lectularius TaxID=79782 RepID=A0A8I6RQX9_CIMLE|nr:nucleoporin GLE1 [Cimex lectularius]
MPFAADMDTEIDKTGFKHMKTKALTKAVWLKWHVNDCTLGPNAPDPSGGITSKETLTMPDNSIFHSTPKKNDAIAKHLRNVSKNEKEQTVINAATQEDLFCSKNIFTQLDRLSVNEAQQAKFAFLRRIEEYKKKRDEEVAQFIAKEEAKWLKIEQQRMEQLAAEKIKMKETLTTNKNQESDKENTSDQTYLNSKQDPINTQANPDTAKLIEEQRRLEEIRQRNSRFEVIFKNREKFMILYNLFLEKISHEDLKSFRAGEMSNAKTANETFSNLMTKCKGDTITDEDVEKSDSFVKILENLCQKAEEVLEKQIELRQKKMVEEEEEKLIKAEKEKQDKENTAKKQTLNCYDLYDSVQKFTNEVEVKLKDFLLDDSLKKFRNDCQKAVNIPVNAISPLDANHLNDKLKRLVTLLQGQTVTVSEKRISAGTHPLGVLYSMYFLANKIVKQGEHVVSSKPESSFAIASVTIAIWLEFPEFGKLLLAQFYKVCPYLIPKYWDKMPDQTEEEYFKKLGFLYSGGEKEDIDKFLKRQGGVVRLYAAIILSPLKKSLSNKPHPLPLSEAWRWTAAFISLKPRAFISATLLLDMLDVTGNAMLAAYGNQYRKMLHFICKMYLPEIEKVTPKGNGGPVMRLKSFLEGIVQGKNIAPPKGLLASNFW